MREKLYKLYKECFEDVSIEAQENYIATRYHGDNEFVFNEGDDIIAMVLGNEISLSVGGGKISAVNLSGLCVKEEERKKGLAKKLIVDAMTQLVKKDVLAVTVAPHDHAFFSKMQFEPFCFSEKIVISNIIEASSPLTMKNVKEMLALYQEYTAKCYISKVRNEVDFINIIEENSLGGMIVGCYNGSKMMAYSIVDSNGKVVETCHLDKFYLNKLGVDYVSLPTGIGKPENMIRVLNVVEFLKQIKYVPEFVINITIKVVDNIIKENSVTLKLDVKNCISTVEVLSDESEFDIEYTIEDLTSTIVRSGLNVMFEKE